MGEKNYVKIATAVKCLHYFNMVYGKLLKFDNMYGPEIVSCPKIQSKLKNFHFTHQALILSHSHNNVLHKFKQIIKNNKR